MAAPVSLTTGSSTINATSYTTASVSPTSGRLYLAAFGCSAASSPTPTCTGCGLTWELVAMPSTASRTVYIFAAKGTPTSGALTFSGGATSMTSGFWNVSEAASVDLSGADAAAALVAANIVAGRPSAATAVSTAFPVTVTAGNGGYAAVLTAVEEAPTAGTGWAALDTPQTQTTPFSGFITMGAAQAPQAIAASWTTSSAHSVVGVEIKAASGLRDITLHVGAGRSRELAVQPGRSRRLTAAGRSRTLTINPRE